MSLEAIIWRLAKVKNGQYVWLLCTIWLKLGDFLLRTYVLGVGRIF